MARLPYPGLRAFRHDETDLFFGREDVVDRMVEKLGATRFLAVLGASGSGKSSVVRTGLIESLHMGFLPAAGSRWRIADITPGGQPMRNLAQALVGEATDPIEAELLEAFLRRGPRSLVEWCLEGNLPESTSMLLLVDQFEELFRYQDYAGREEAEAFAALLIESARTPCPIYVAVTMRSEYLGACTLIAGLAEAINRGQFLTPRMTREECRRAIVGPAGVCGFSVGEPLVNRLLNDLEQFAPWEEGQEEDQVKHLARRADQLPLLQHALNRMWTLAHNQPGGRDPLVLTVADYEAIGGLRGTIDGQAQEIMAELGPERAEVVQTVFRALTNGTSASDAVRRPTRFEGLVALAGGRADDVRAVIDAFGAPGRSLLQTKTAGELDDSTLIDISHESLIRQWSQLSDWVAREAESAARWRSLRESAQLHRAGKGDLLSGLNLANVADWWEHENPTAKWAQRYGGDYDQVATFVADSRDHDRALRERQAAMERELQEAQLRRAEQERAVAEERVAAARRLQRRTFAGLAAMSIVAIVALALGVVAWDRYVEEGKARAGAEDAYRVAAQATEDATEAQRATAEALRQINLALSLIRVQKAIQLTARSTNARTLMVALRVVVDSIPPVGTPVPGTVDALRWIVHRLDTLDLADKFPVDMRLRDDGPGHRGGVTAVAYSPDGRLVATGSQDWLVSIWSVEDGALLKTISGHSGAVRDVAFSADGTRLLTAADDATARLWSVPDGAQLQVFENEHTSALRAARLSPDGRLMVTGGDDRTALIWSVDEGRVLHRLEEHDDYINEVDFSPSGTLVLTVSHDNTGALWDAASGELVAKLVGHEGAVLGGRFSPDGAMVATAARDSTLRLWSAETGEELALFQGVSPIWFYGVTFSPDGRHLLSADDDDRAAKLWSIATREMVTDLRAHSALINSVAFAPDGSHFVTASDDRTAAIWRTDSPSPLLRLGQAADAVVAIGYSPDGNGVIAVYSDATVRIWSRNGGGLMDRFVLDGVESVSTAEISRTGLIAVADNDAAARVWSLDAGDWLLPPLSGHGGSILDIAFSPDGTMLATASSDYTALVWSLESGKTQHRLTGHSDWVRSVAFSPDGRTVATASDDHSVRLWSVETGMLLQPPLSDHDNWVYAVAFSPDGEAVATGGRDQVLRAWAADTQELVLRVETESIINYLDFSPDGSTLLALFADGTAHLYSVLLSTPIARLVDPEDRAPGAVHTAAFAPDGKSLATGDAVGVSHVYGLPEWFATLPGSELARLQHRAEQAIADMEPLTHEERCAYYFETEGCEEQLFEAPLTDLFERTFAPGEPPHEPGIGEMPDHSPAGPEQPHADKQPQDR